jgi:AbrB family looped-hinge helix DNA binding protein
MKTHVNKKGQIVIPSALRKKYGIKEGTGIVLLENEDSIVLKPITDQYLKNLQGSLKGTGALRALIVERREYKFR